VDQQIGPAAGTGGTLEVERDALGLEPSFQLGESASRGVGIFDHDPIVFETLVQPAAGKSLEGVRQRPP
jgi:hypothetical protein